MHVILYVSVLGTGYAATSAIAVFSMVVSMNQSHVFMDFGVYLDWLL